MAGASPNRVAARSAKWAASLAMSSRRSRSGGSTIGNTAIRYHRSSRNRPLATIDARSRCVAATIRTSTLIGFSPPTRSIQPSCKMRNMRTWAASGNSPISSRNSVPPSARSNQPRRDSTAPVNAPRS